MATSIQFGASKRLTYAPKPEQAYSTNPTSIYQKGAEDEQEKVVTRTEARLNYSSYPDPQQDLHPFHHRLILQVTRQEFVYHFHQCKVPDFVD